MPPSLLAKYTLADIVFGGLVQLLTLPYHRFFTYNTLKPVQEIVKHANRGVGPNDPDREQLYGIIASWRSRKKDELNFAALAATVITAIVTASFSWGNVEASIWVGPAFWYASLSTSICGIFLSAQQLSLLSLMGELPEGEARTTPAATMRRHLGQVLMQTKARDGEGEDSEAAENGAGSGSGGVWVVSWRLVFTWQCPMMFIAYSAFFYIVGLSVVVLTPLIKEPWGENSYIAVAYAASTALAWSLFAFCSLGGYGKIEMHQREDEEAEERDEGGIGTYHRADTTNTGADTMVAAADAVTPAGEKDVYGR